MAGDHEGLKAARLLMVLSSLSPLFVLWAVRGNTLIPDYFFIMFCVFMVVFPNGFLLFRVYTAKKLHEVRELTVGKADDSRGHILVYLFTMLILFYGAHLDSWRNVGTTFVALAFIVFLFWYLNLHYINIFFALRGYHIFTIYAPENSNPFTCRAGMILITPRTTLSSGQKLKVYRLSDTVYWETKV